MGWSQVSHSWWFDSFFPKTKSNHFQLSCRSALIRKTLWGTHVYDTGVAACSDYRALAWTLFCDGGSGSYRATLARKHSETNYNGSEQPAYRDMPTGVWWSNKSKNNTREREREGRGRGKGDGHDKDWRDGRESSIMYLEAMLSLTFQIGHLCSAKQPSDWLERLLFCVVCNL